MMSHLHFADTYLLAYLIARKGIITRLRITTGVVLAIKVCAPDEVSCWTVEAGLTLLIIN